MKQYEIMTILKADLKESGARDASNSIKDLITSKGGKILNSDFWGKRKFAYEIDHDTEGFYEVVNFNVEPSVIPELKQSLNYNEGLVRYLIITTEE